MEIKNKITNHLMKNGNKRTGEKILLKSAKEIQKGSKKQSKKLIQLAIIYSIPTFKLHKIKNKKQKKRNKKIREIPTFIAKEKARISLAIKFILATTKKPPYSCYTKLKQEILLNAQYKGSAIHVKNELQKEVILNKRYFSYYRWR